jgi:hypothetical protein
MDDVVRYENRPEPKAASCWDVLFYRFLRAIDTVPGQELRIFGSHDRHSVTIWTEADTSSKRFHSHHPPSLA